MPSVELVTGLRTRRASVAPEFYSRCFVHVLAWYARRMLAKLNLMKPLVVAGAVAAAIAAAPTAAAEVFAAGPAMTGPRRPTSSSRTTRAAAAATPTATAAPAARTAARRRSGRPGLRSGRRLRIRWTVRGPRRRAGRHRMSAGRRLRLRPRINSAYDRQPPGSLVIQARESAGSMTSSSSNVVADRSALPCW